MTIWFVLIFLVILIKILFAMANHLNFTYQQSLKGTQTTAIGLSSHAKDTNNNVTDLYKEDSVSSDQPIPYALNTKVQDLLLLQQQQMQHNQIKKFMKKAQKLNQMSYRKLHQGKALMPESSSINIYKSNKNILEQFNFPTQRDRQIKSIYLKGGNKNLKNVTYNLRKTFKSTNASKRKSTTDSKWVQTDNLNAQNHNQTYNSLSKQKPHLIQHNSNPTQVKKLKKTLKAIEEDEDEQFIPVKRKNQNKRVFNTISLTGDLRRAKVDANTYLNNVSRNEHQFSKSVKRYQVKPQFKSNTTFYHEQQKTTNQSSFFKTIANQSNPWQNMVVQQKQKSKQISTLPLIRQKTSILQQTNKQTQANKQPQIPKITKINPSSKNIHKQITQNSLFVQNNNSIKKSQVSDTEFTIFKGNFSHNFQQKQMIPIVNVEKSKKKNVQQTQNFAQMPQVHQIAIGTDTNNFIKNPKKIIHPINYGFSESDTSWITSHYKPKSQFLRNIDTKTFNIKKYRNGVYFGQLSDLGLKQGKGVVFYFNGRSYQGNFTNDLKEGKGFQYMPDGSVYTGQYKKGLKQGKGMFQWPNGEIYDGQWIAGKRNGSGMWKSSKGDSYLGEWKNGKIQGFGVLTVKQGDRYQGEFKNSMKNGLGTQRYSNGDTYVGQFSKNRPNGQGQYYFSNGDIYKGFFSNGLKHGNGVYKNKNGEVYQGEFRNQKKCGYGQQTNQQGATYKGNFENGLKHGYGQLTSSDGMITKGYWINGQIIETQMAPILEDQLDRQQSIANNLKLKNKNKKQKNNNDEFIHSKNCQRRRSLRKSPRNSSIQKSLSPSDPNFHRACGCKRKH